MASAFGGDTRPIVIKRVKKVAAGHHGGAWKVAYADFVTAMMAFFMLLWLLSAPDEEQLHSLADYFSPSVSPASATGGEAFGPSAEAGGMPADQAGSVQAAGQPGMQPSNSGLGAGGTASIPDATQRVLAAELRIALDPAASPQDADDAVQVEADPDGVRITLMDSMRRSMFRTASADLNSFARAYLVRIADKLAETSASVSIEGHTDGVGDSDANWRLSGERALAARSAMIAGGLPADRFDAVIARGASAPVYPDQPDRPENRRITIVVKSEAPVLPDQSSFTF